MSRLALAAWHVLHDLEESISKMLKAVQGLPPENSADFLDQNGKTLDY